MENDRDRLMTFFLCWVSPIFKKRSITQADHGERKKEKAALPSRSDGARRGDAPTRTGLCPPGTEAGAPPPGPPLLFSLAGSRCPREASDSRALGPASTPGSGQPLPGLALPERYRLEMRAPAAATWKTQRFSPLPTLSAEFGTNAGLGADSRRASATPTPPECGRVGSGTLHPAPCSLRPGRPSPRPGRPAGQLSGSRRGTWELEKGRPQERNPPPDPAAPTPCCPERAGPGARRGEEPNAPHRDRGFAPTPLRWTLFFQRCANNSSPDANFPPFFPNSASVQLRSNRRELKRRGKSGAKSPAD